MILKFIDQEFIAWDSYIFSSKKSSPSVTDSLGLVRPESTVVCVYVAAEDPTLKLQRKSYIHPTLGPGGIKSGLKAFFVDIAQKNL